MRAEGEWIIAATGRKPVLCDCAPALAQERGRLITDACGRTSVPTIYAAGDVTSRIQLAHLASAQAINAVDTMLGRTPQFDLNCVPSCLYTHPEAAWVGLSEEEAQAQGLSVIVGKTTTLSNSKSMIEQAPRGACQRLDRHSGSGRQPAFDDRRLPARDHGSSNLE